MLNRCVVATLCILLCFSDCSYAQSSSSYSSGQNAPTIQDCEMRPETSGCEQVRREIQLGRSGAEDGTNSRSESTSSDTDIVVGTEKESQQFSESQRRPTPGRSSTTAQTVLPPITEPPTEFQEFVDSSVGKRLPIFGQNLFYSVPSTFAQADRIPVTDDYVIGPGDELLIRAWGQININARVVVDRSGEIFLPKVGSVRVAGTQFHKLRDDLKASIGRVFRNFDLTVTLGQLRSIQVFVVGYARRPGAYTVSSLSTLVNALFASGGPSSRGSMRHIEVKRNNAVVTDFDLYDLLLRGDKSKDVVLMPGDVIYIPAIGPQIAMYGSVNFPAIYELRSVSTLDEQVEVAGGLTTVADGGRVIVERIEGRATRNIDEFKLDEAGLKRELKDGDLVRVFSISPKFENAVTIRGNVAQPGRFPWRDGMRVRDLIPSREFLLTRQFWLQQNGVSASLGVVSDWRLDRQRQSRTQLERTAEVQGEDPESGIAATDSGRDSLRDEQSPSRESFWSREPRAESRRVEPSTGRNQSERQKDFRNDVKRSAPEINWDYAVIQRMDPVDLSTKLIPFNLGKAILGENDQDNVVLRAGDIVTIFSQQDMAVGLDRQSKFVRLEGEFRAAGVYKVENGETLRALIARVGLTDGAYLFGTQFTRESARIEQQRSLDRLVRDMEIEAERLSLAASGASGQTDQAIRARVDSQHALVERFRAVKATGRVVLEIGTSQSGLEAFPEIALEDGDRIYVPHRPATVGVLGAVYNPSAFLFKEGMRVSDYLKMAGSGTRESDMKHTFVIRADGSVVSERTTSGLWSGGLSSVRIHPGDTVVVPAQLDKGAFMRGFKDWTQVFSQLALGAAAINVLK